MAGSFDLRYLGNLLWSEVKSASNWGDSVSCPRIFINVCVVFVYFVALLYPTRSQCRDSSAGAFFWTAVFSNTSVAFSPTRTYRRRISVGRQILLLRFLLEKSAILVIVRDKQKGTRNYPDVYKHHSYLFSSLMLCGHGQCKVRKYLRTWAGRTTRCRCTWDGEASTAAAQERRHRHVRRNSAQVRLSFVDSLPMSDYNTGHLPSLSIPSLWITEPAFSSVN